MKVHMDYRNKNMDIIYSEDIDFDLYCVKVSRDIISILSDIETIFYDTKEIDTDRYKKLRHRIFDVAGSVKRLPDNIISSDDVNSDTFSKPTKQNFLKLFGDEI